MAQVIDPSKNLIKLDNGKTITAQTGGWYDAQQYWGGTLSAPGVIHQQNPNQGGTTVNPEVVKASNVQQGLAPGTNEAYIKSQQAKYGQANAPTSNYGFNAGATMATGTSAPTSAGTGVSLPEGLGVASPINLPNIYNSLYSSSGISDKEKQLVDLETKYLEARNTISDNPFAEASMVDKRLKRLEQKYELQTAPLKSEIAMKKADIETQLNLQTKQFDINSQSAKDALSYFNTLLEAGALDGATGDDIANLTRATGISSSMLQSAINANKAKNVKTSLQTFTADSGEVTAVTIDENTGRVISSTSLGMIGNKQTSGGGGTVSERNAEKKQGVFQEIQAELDRLGGEDKFVSPDEWKYLRLQWINQGFSGEEFDDAFRGIYIGNPKSRGFSLSSFGLE